MKRLTTLVARASVVALLLLAAGGGIASADQGSGPNSFPDDPGYPSSTTVSFPDDPGYGP